MSFSFIKSINNKSFNLGPGWSLRLGDGYLHYELKYKDINSKPKKNGKVGENSITVSIKYTEPFRGYWVTSKLHFAIINFLSDNDENKNNCEVINNLKDKLLAETEGMTLGLLTDFIVKIALTQPVK